MNNRDMQNLVRQYRQENNKMGEGVRHSDVAKWAIDKGLYRPKPVDLVDKFAQELSRAAREETRRDAQTGRPYRVNHAVRVKQGDQQITLWVDIDTAKRSHMHRSLFHRREQMAADGLQLSLDADHWNTMNPTEEPIQIPFDFTEDIEWAKNSPAEDEDAA